MLNILALLEIDHLILRPLILVCGMIKYVLKERRKRKNCYEFLNKDIIHLK